MATIVIDTDTSAPFFNQTTTLDGVPYLLTFRYNFREQVYYLQICSADGSTTYAQGLKLVSNYSLLRGYGAVPPGELLAMSTNPDDSPARLGELGAGCRVQLVYIEQSDVIARGGEAWRNPFAGMTEIVVSLAISNLDATLIPNVETAVQAAVMTDAAEQVIRVADCIAAAQQASSGGTVTACSIGRSDATLVAQDLVLSSREIVALVAVTVNGSF